MSGATATRKSVQAIVEETTAGTPVDPSSGTQVIPLQEGFEMTPSFETQDNVELSPSVDTKAPIIGLETPESTIGHYFRHSGTEATAPNYDILLKATLGTKVAAPAQRSTTTGSTSGDINTRAVVKLGAGGSDFQRGSAVLCKDSANGYFIRNAYSVSGNDLTLQFNLTQAAPGSGVGVGRPILYKTSDELPSLTHWIYLANGTAAQAMTGARVASATINATVGEPLNMEFTLAGTKAYFDPVRIDSNDRYLDFNLGAGELSAAVNAKLYTTPHELAEALEEAMENTGASGTFIVDYKDYGNASGKFYVAHSGGVLNLLWNTGTNTANTIGDALGFTVSADDSGASGYFSDTAQSWAAPFSSTADSNVNPLIVKNNEVLFGTFERTVCTEVQEMSMTIENELQDVRDICSESGVGEKLLGARTVTVEMTMTLKKHDAKAFEQFRLGDTVSFAYNGGIKTGGNWVAGRCVNFCLMEGRITEFVPGDADDVVVLSVTIQGVANASGEGIVFINLL
jgi:hypothetical protein